MLLLSMMKLDRALKELQNDILFVSKLFSTDAITTSQVQSIGCRWQAISSCP